MDPKPTRAPGGSDARNQTNATSQRGGPDAGEDLIVVGVWTSSELSQVGFSFDTTKVDRAPILTPEQEARYRLLKDASRYISNTKPAEALENFPARRACISADLNYKTKPSIIHF